MKTTFTEFVSTSPAVLPFSLGCCRHSGLASLTFDSNWITGAGRASWLFRSLVICCASNIFRQKSHASLNASFCACFVAIGFPSTGPIGDTSMSRTICLQIEFYEIELFLWALDENLLLLTALPVFRKMQYNIFWPRGRLLWLGWAIFYSLLLSQIQCHLVRIEQVGPFSQFFLYAGPSWILFSYEMN